MKLGPKRRIAADVLGVGRSRVWFDSEKMEDIKQAITKEDIRALVREGVVRAKPKTGISGARARKTRVQKSKGRRRGLGSRKGKSGARLSKKTRWVGAIRSQREFMNMLRGKGYIDASAYRLLRRKAKGGFFRSRRHIKLFLEDRGLLKASKK